MKKCMTVIVLLLCMLFSFQRAKSKPIFINEQAENVKNMTFLMPSSLLVIEDEAFADTAVASVRFPDSLVSIGKMAFAGSSGLQSIYIPESVTYIADNAFEGIHDLKMQGVRGSYAACWALTHNVPFIWDSPIPGWLIRLMGVFHALLVLSLFFACDLQNEKYQKLRKTTYRERSMRPQDRLELYPIDYRFP